MKWGLPVNSAVGGEAERPENSRANGGSHVGETSVLGAAVGRSRGCWGEDEIIDSRVIKSRKSVQKWPTPGVNPLGVGW